MSSDIQKYVPLKQVISYFIDENSLSWDELDKSWVIAFRALVELNQSIAAEPITTRLPVEGNKTVVLPSDYLSWSKIGVMDSNGQLSTLKVNTAITTFKDNNPNRLSHLTPDINNVLKSLSVVPFYYNYGYNGSYQTLYGAGDGLVQFGECVVDETNNIIVLEPEFKYDSVLLEYVSSPQENGDYEIQTVLQEAVIAFLAWKYKLGSRDAFYAAKIDGRRSLPKKKVTLQEIAQAIRQDNGMFIKA